MKRQTFTALLLGLSFCAAAQDSVSTSGGDGSGGGGSISYSVGQIAYTSVAGSGGTMSQGVQQAYEIFELATQTNAKSVSHLVYPNPTSDILMLQSGDYSHDMKYQIVDINGRLLRDGKIESEQHEIDFSFAASGTYILNIQRKNKPVQSFKILKK